MNNKKKDFSSLPTKGFVITTNKYIIDFFRELFPEVKEVYLFNKHIGLQWDVIKKQYKFVSESKDHEFQYSENDLLLVLKHIEEEYKGELSYITPPIPINTDEFLKKSLKRKTILVGENKDHTLTIPANDPFEDDEEISQGEVFSDIVNVLDNQKEGPKYHVSNFDKIINLTLKQISETLLIKAKEYVRNDDVYHNFNIGSSRTGLIPEKVLDGFLLKHEISISDMTNDIEKGILPKKETVNEKFNDNIIYLLIKKAMIIERIEKQTK